MKKLILGGIFFFFLATLCFLVLSLLAVPWNEVEFTSQDELLDGVLDLTDVDISDTVIYVASSLFTDYPNQLLEPEECGEAGTGEAVRYGTRRIRVRLNPGRVYGISQTCLDFALRIFVDGEEIGTLGTVGKTKKDSQAQAGNIVSAFVPQSEITEISFWYSGFVRKYGPPSIYLSSVGQITLHQQRLEFRDVLFAGCMLSAMLLFLGMFLFFGHKPQFLYFALFCLGLTINELVTASIPLSLLQPLSASLALRMEYMSNWVAMCMFFLYVREVFREFFHPFSAYVTWVLLAAYAAVAVLMDPLQLNMLRPRLSVVIEIFQIYLAIRLLMHVRKPRPEQTLVLVSVMLYIIISLVDEYILRGRVRYHLAQGFYTSAATIGVIFLNMIALSIYAMRAEQDLLEARRLEESLKQSNRALDRLYRLQNEFLQTASHELRAPLTVMSGHAQLSAQKLRDRKPAEEIPPHLEMIIQEANRLSQLVSNLLSGIVADSARQGEVSDPVQVIRHCAKLYAPLFQKKKNDLSLSIPDASPAVALDSASLTQILLNLLTNANRHTKAGHIEIGAREERSDMLLWVADDGEGIPLAMQPIVFERYVRDETQDSNGLGLAICKEIVVAAGGEIGLDSAPAKGTRLWFRLPIARDDVVEA